MDKIASWIIWLIILAGNGFIVFMWLVFGLAAAGSISRASPFIWMTGLGTGIPVFASLYFMIRAKFAIGLTLNFLILPVMFGVFFLVGAFLRP